MRVKNTSGLGDLYVPGVGTITAGETVEVDNETGKRLLEQSAHFEAAEKKTTKEK